MKYKLERFDKTYRLELRNIHVSINSRPVSKTGKTFGDLSSYVEFEFGRVTILRAAGLHLIISYILKESKRRLFEWPGMLSVNLEYSRNYIILFYLSIYLLNSSHGSVFLFICSFLVFKVFKC